MDIERGNIEILFQKINYMAIGRQINFGEEINRFVHSHKNIDRKLYMRCAENIFPYMNEDERENGYLLACRQMKDAQGENPSVFRLITDLSKKLLRLDGDEIKCRFDQLLRWREIHYRLVRIFLHVRIWQITILTEDLKQKNFLGNPLF